MKRKINKNMAKEIVTLSQIAKELEMNKSNLHYWVGRGLLTPSSTLGTTFAFAKTETIAKIKKINKLKEKGKTIEEIVKILKK